MDAADPGEHHLSGADGTGSDLVHGVLNKRVEGDLHPFRLLKGHKEAPVPFFVSSVFLQVGIVDAGVIDGL